METIEVLRLLDKETEGSVYLVGGFVRDFLRNKRNDDLDIVIRNITLEKVLDFLKPHGKTEEIKLSSKGNKFSSIDIILFRAFKDREGIQAQVTLARRGKKQIPSAGNTLTQDSKFRDFKLNALYLPINFRSKKDVIDKVGGVNDIKKREINPIGSATERIKESPIRIMRAISLAARIGYKINKELEVSIRENVELLHDVPPENVRNELNKILLSKKPSKYIKIMEKLGVLQVVLPELRRCVGIKQDRRYHKWDVFNHSVYACDNMEPDLILRLSAVLHDIGKPGTMKRLKNGNETKTTFYKHDVLGGKLAKNLLERLKYDSKVVKEVTKLIKLHMYHYTSDMFRCEACKWTIINSATKEAPIKCRSCGSTKIVYQIGWTDMAVRKFITRAGITEKDLENLEEFSLFKLRSAERLGNGYKNIAVTEKQKDFQKRIITVYKQSHGLTVKDLDINGDAILETFNMEESPKVGDVLIFLLDKVLEHPPLNNRLDLLKLTVEYLFRKDLVG